MIKFEVRSNDNKYKKPTIEGSRLTNIVQTSNNKMVAVFVTKDTIPREVVSGIGFHVDAQISRMITKARASHTRPWLLNSKDSFQFSGFVWVRKLSS